MNSTKINDLSKPNKIPKENSHNHKNMEIIPDCLSNRKETRNFPPIRKLEWTAQTKRWVQTILSHYTGERVV